MVIYRNARGGTVEAPETPLKSFSLLIAKYSQNDIYQWKVSAPGFWTFL